MRNLIALCLMTFSMAAYAEIVWRSPEEAHYKDHVSIYNHHIFETPHEFKTLQYMGWKITLPQSGEDAAVFEGISPISILYKDKIYIVATVSDLKKGSYIALFEGDRNGYPGNCANCLAPSAELIEFWNRREAGEFEMNFELVDQTEPIGRAHRWLALAWRGNLDGNGYPEIGYVETPHLGGIAKLYEIRDGKLVYLDEVDGVSNHKIGTDKIWDASSLEKYRKWIVPDQNFENWMVLDWDGQKFTKNVYKPISK